MFQYISDKGDVAVVPIAKTWLNKGCMILIKGVDLDLYVLLSEFWICSHVVD